MQKQENSTKEIYEKLVAELEILSLNFIEDNMNDEDSIVREYKKIEIQEQLKIVERYIKRKDFKEKVEIKYENILRDGKK